jgi:hypothetical protein
VAFVLGCKTKDVVVTLTRDEIQQRISAKFPVTKRVLLVDVVLQEPTVVLPEGSNRVGIDVVVNVHVPLIAPLSGRIGATGVPRYEPKSKEFYLDEPTIERLELPALKPEHEPKVRAAVEKIAHDALSRHPIYELKARNLKEVTAAFVLKEVLVRDGKLQATLALP